MSQDVLLKEVSIFADRYGLVDELPTLQKGAILAQGETDFQDVLDLTKEEVEILEAEVTNKWRQPWSLYFTICVCSLGAIVQGMCVTYPHRSLADVWH